MLAIEIYARKPFLFAATHVCLMRSSVIQQMVFVRSTFNFATTEMGKYSLHIFEWQKGPHGASGKTVRKHIFIECVWKTIKNGIEHHHLFIANTRVEWPREVLPISFKNHWLCSQHKKQRNFTNLWKNFAFLLVVLARTFQKSKFRLCYGIFRDAKWKMNKCYDIHVTILSMNLQLNSQLISYHKMFVMTTCELTGCQVAIDLQGNHHYLLVSVFHSSNVYFYVAVKTRYRINSSQVCHETTGNRDCWHGKASHAKVGINYTKTLLRSGHCLFLTFNITSRMQVVYALA